MAANSSRDPSEHTINGFLRSREQGHSQRSAGSRKRNGPFIHPLTYRPCLTTSYSARGDCCLLLLVERWKNGIYRIRPFKRRSACSFCHVLSTTLQDLHPFALPSESPGSISALVCRTPSRIPCFELDAGPHSGSAIPPLPGSLSQPPTCGAQYLIYYLRPIISREKARIKAGRTCRCPASPPSTPFPSNCLQDVTTANRKYPHIRHSSLRTQPFLRAAQHATAGSLASRAGLAIWRDPGESRLDSERRHKAVRANFNELRDTAALTPVLPRQFPPLVSRAIQPGCVNLEPLELLELPVRIGRHTSATLRLFYRHRRA